jgi:hypothetical protein
VKRRPHFSRADDRPCNPATFTTHTFYMRLRNGWIDTSEDFSTSTTDAATVPIPRLLKEKLAREGVLVLL